MTTSIKTTLLLSFLCATLVSHSQWSTICGTGNGFVDDFDTLNGELYATGFFTSICGTPASYVAKYDGNDWQAVGNGFPNAGHHLETINNELYGVAYQPAVDSNWLYRYDGTDFTKFGEGVYLTTATPGFSQTANLYNVIDYNGSIIVCGEFDRVGTKPISGIMEWDGTEWDSLGSRLSGNIPGSASVMYPHDLCLFGSDLIVAGNFHTAGGQVVNGVARWDGIQWYPLGQGFNSTVYSIAVYNGELYAGGDFSMSGSTSLTNVAKWDGTNWIDPGFSMYYNNPGYYSFIHTLKVLDNQLVISGGFDRVVFGSDTMHCQAVAAYDGTVLDTLSGGVLNKEVEALAMYDGQLFAGGGTNNTNSFVASYNLLSAGLKPQADPISISLFPNPSRSGFRVMSEQAISDIRISNAVGQTVYSLQPIEKNISIPLDNEGVYFVTVTCGQQSITRKLVIEH